MNDKTRPGIKAGVILGVISIAIALISGVLAHSAAPVDATDSAAALTGANLTSSLLSCLNCLLMFALGAYAVRLYTATSTVPASIGDGAQLGAITGVVGGLLSLLIGLPISYFLNGAATLRDLAAAAEQAGTTLPENTGAALFLILGIVGLIITIVACTIGGMIGVPLFEKRQANSFDENNFPPPPSPGI